MKNSLQGNSGETLYRNSNGEITGQSRAGNFGNTIYQDRNGANK